MKPWTKRRRTRLLAIASVLDKWAAGIRASVKAHTSRRVRKPKLKAVA